jgi:hypothetical protein
MARRSRGGGDGGHPGHRRHVDPRPPCASAFAYSHPLPVDQTSTDAHWARFTWEIFEGFRWSEFALYGYAVGIWDVSTAVGGTEFVLVPGATGYYTTSSVD